MLLILYLFIDQLRFVFTLLVLLSCIGCFSILIEDFIIQSVGENSKFKHEIDFPLFGKTSIASIIGTVTGIALSVAWFITKNWVLNNILGLALAITFLKTMRLTTLVPGLLLIGLLFFYDIFWVFISPVFTGGNSVMMVVATGLDIPIKLVMPHLTNYFPTTACSLLGLGDILIPGIFICFMARFGTEVAKTEVYFYAAIFAYTVALLCCGASLWIFNAAQPALLYIVPALYIAVFSVGLFRGEIELMKKGIPHESHTNTEEHQYKPAVLGDEGEMKQRLTDKRKDEESSSNLEMQTLNNSYSNSNQK